jgi:hypothetical protein
VDISAVDDAGIGPEASISFGSLQGKKLKSQIYPDLEDEPMLTGLMPRFDQSELETKFKHFLQTSKKLPLELLETQLYDLTRRINVNIFTPLESVA